MVMVDTISHTQLFDIFSIFLIIMCGKSTVPFYIYICFTLSMHIYTFVYEQSQSRKEKLQCARHFHQALTTKLNKINQYKVILLLIIVILISLWIYVVS